MRYIYIFLLSSFLFNATVFWAPAIDCGNLPGCGDNGWASLDTPVNFIAALIAEVIKYVAVIAVIAMMLSGFMYLLSGGDEEKVKKAKMWITWSLIGVLLSVSSWYIINIINNFRI